MSVILCATRGGEASYRTQDKAIAMAKERGDSLLFLYVVDLDFLNKMAAPFVVDIEDEIGDMGDFFLLMAKERAAELGVNATTVCRKGKIRQEIKEVALEQQVALVVLGRPTGSDSAFHLLSLEAFANEITEETGIEATII